MSYPKHDQDSWQDDLRYDHTSGQAPQPGPYPPRRQPPDPYTDPYQQPSDYREPTEYHPAGAYPQRAPYREPAAYPPPAYPQQQPGYPAPPPAYPPGYPPTYPPAGYADDRSYPHSRDGAYAPAETYDPYSDSGRYAPDPRRAEARPGPYPPDGPYRQPDAYPPQRDPYRQPAFEPRGMPAQGGPPQSFPSDGFPAQGTEEPARNKYALAALILGILGGWGFIVLWLGIRGIQQARRTGRGMAMSIIGMVLAVAWIPIEVHLAQPSTPKAATVASQPLADAGCDAAESNADKLSPTMKVDATAADTTKLGNDYLTLATELTKAAALTKIPAASAAMKTSAADFREYGTDLTHHTAPTAALSKRLEPDAAAVDMACGAH